MKTTILASDLQPGDYIMTPEGTAYFHRVPIDKTATFTAYYMAPLHSKALNGPVTFEPDEQVEVLARWPYVFGEQR